MNCCGFIGGSLDVGISTALSCRIPNIAEVEINKLKKTEVDN